MNNVGKSSATERHGGLLTYRMSRTCFHREQRQRPRQNVRLKKTKDKLYNTKLQLSFCPSTLSFFFPCLLTQQEVDQFKFPLIRISTREMFPLGSRISQIRGTHVLIQEFAGLKEPRPVPLGPLEHAVGARGGPGVQLHETPGSATAHEFVNREASHRR